MFSPPSLQVVWGLSAREVGSGAWGTVRWGLGVWGPMRWGLGAHEVLLLSPHRW